MSTPMSFATPSKCSFRVEQSGDVLSLRRRTGSYSGAFFITIWLIGWTVGCIALAGLVAKQPTIQHLLFAIPFWASWFFAAAMLVVCRVRDWRLFWYDGLTGGRSCRSDISYN